MAEFIRVEHAQYSPTRCVLCQRVEGPMVSCSLNDIEVLTEHGVREVAGHVYVCLGTADTPGCAVQMARLAGSVDEPLYRAAQETISRQSQHIAELEARIVRLEAGAPQVLDLHTAQQLIEGRKIKVPARPQ